MFWFGWQDEHCKYFMLYLSQYTQRFFTMTKIEVITFLKNKKDEFYAKYGITTLGLYGSYARDEATNSSDVDIFYERDKNFDLQSGLDFLNIGEKLAKELKVSKVDFVSLDYMNPIVKHYAKKDFIYV